MTERVQFSKRANKDIGRIDTTTRERVRKAVTGLVELPPRPNLDVRPLVGHAPWLRLRIGDVRVILRPLSSDERRQVNVDAPAYLVERVIDRRDLERAADSLR